MAAPAPTATPGTGEPVYIVAGREVRLPVVVRDAVSVSATYVVPATAVQRLLPDGLWALESIPGRTIVVLAAVEYRDNDLGCYNEFAVNFFVVHAATRPLPIVGGLLALARGTYGTYVHALPVTTTFSRDAGCDIWGFPKTVATITFEDTADRRTCRLEDGGQHVLTFSAPRGGTRRFGGRPLEAYAWRHGQTYATRYTMAGDGVGTRLGGAELVLGVHPLADDLRRLGLPRRALATLAMEHLSASFPAPRAWASSPPPGRRASDGR
jgi:hypothetical protein